MGPSAGSFDVIAFIVMALTELVDAAVLTIFAASSFCASAVLTVTAPLPIVSDSIMKSNNKIAIIQ